MGTMGRRSVLRASVGLATSGTLARPYIANAAATTAAVWWVQGFVQEEDVAFKKIVADYEKASGNTIDYSIIPYAPMRQKIVSAVTSGVVPDLFQNTPAETHCALCLGRQAGRCHRRRRDAKGGIHRDRAALRLSATTTSRKSAAITACPIPPRRCRTTSGGRWSRRPATRSRTSRRPGMPITISSRTCRRNCAPRACARSMASVSR